MSNPVAVPSANSKRRLHDASLQPSIALPAAGASSVTAAIDFGNQVLGPTADSVEIEVVVPATPSLVDTKNLTLTIQDSADGTTFAAIPGGPAPIVTTGAGGAGGPAVDTTVRLPWFTRRYVRLQATVDAAGGSNIAQSATMFVNPVN